ncbi:DUF2294 domain-containing protein [Oscillatoria sp. FACHB-1407]|uniref:DUF2294 domain-containing protein n=1 Tax=Oscillatoria sp. FACHB-1407 TaxID=2692847 RepID=UPI001687231D|nr:DUF2294 domain-containing protein [Oscillatoria sp. FACHB-1407]MBD2463779.1 DUF2294 domain-containing protein [Oscillatoria sp. FACHB-1407]
MQASDPTRGQLERSLAQGIEALYRRELGHRPTKVSCRIFDDKIAIVLEEAITQPEQLLANSGQEELAEQVRGDLDKALRPQLVQLIEETVGVSVTDMLSDATLETGRTGTIAILSAPPQVRPNSEPKVKKSKASESETGEA